MGYKVDSGIGVPHLIIFNVSRYAYYPYTVLTVLIVCPIPYAYTNFKHKRYVITHAPKKDTYEYMLM